MQRYFDTVQDANGRAVAGATVTVYTSGVANPLPVIYQTTGSKTAPSVQNNPMTTDPLGNFGFAAPDGTYDIVISGGGIPTKTLANVNFFDGGITYPSPMLGTVTSVSLSAPAQFAVGGSPVTGSGTLSLTWETQTANTVLAGPTSGAAAAPTFRAMVAADLPTVGTAGVKGSATKVPVFTTDAYGRVIANTDTTVTPAWGSITGTPTTLAGYGITDAAPIASVSAYTGDLRWTINPTPPTGWVLADGGTIGDASSGADRANADTADLFALIWNNIDINYCQIYTSAGVVTTKGGSAAADYALHYRIQTPNAKGRALVGTGTGTFAPTFTADAGTDIITLARSYPGLTTGMALTLSNSGGALPAGLSATTYYAIRSSDSACKLATSVANAVAGTYVDITDAGTGTHTATLTLTARANGQFGGEEQHALLLAELTAHGHTILGGTSTSNGNYMRTTDSASSFTTAIQSAGGSGSHNIMQPYLTSYCHIKL